MVLGWRGKEIRAPLTVGPRHLEGVVGKPVRVQIPPSALSQYSKSSSKSSMEPVGERSLNETLPP